MEFEQALTLVNTTLLAQVDRSLSDLEIDLLRGAWENLTYEEISSTAGYSLNYLQRDIGPKFWKLLSKAFGRKLNKTNVRAILTQKVKEQQLAVTASSQQTALVQTVPVDNSADSVTSTVAAQVQQRTIAQPISASDLPPSTPSIDWGEMLDVSIFYGRTQDMEILNQWIIGDRCRLVALLGLGGIGKSSLAAKVAHDLQDQFEYIIWRSLRNAPPLETLLDELILFLSNQQDTHFKPERLLYWLRQSRCLVILDNVETIMQAGNRAGCYQSGYEGYGDLLKLIGETNHQSCVMLTSREMPVEVSIMESCDGKVRSHALTGCLETALTLLDTKGISGTAAEKHQLCEYYSCNPLALKIVASSIQSLFDGAIALFFKEDTLVFNGLSRLLEQHFERLSLLERTIMYWLAINREGTTIAELLDDIFPSISRANLLEALESLTWRSLIEKAKPTQLETQSSSYTQQPVVMEYVTERLIKQIGIELNTTELNLFLSHALIKATVKDYVRASQTRLILHPIAEQLCGTFRTIASLEQHIGNILATLKRSGDRLSGYGGGNLINLCVHLNLDLTPYNFSGLPIWQAYLQGANVQRVKFTQCDFSRSCFTQAFSSIFVVTFSPDGQFVATGDDNGNLRLWYVTNNEPVWNVQGHTSTIWDATFSPDGQVLVSGGSDQTIQFWDVRTGQRLNVLSGHKETVRSVAVSPDGNILASASADCTIKLWDMATGTLLHTLEGHTDWVRSVAFSPDGQWLVSGSFDHTLRLWNVASGALQQVLTGHTNMVTGVAGSPKGDIFASCSDDQTVRLWDWHTGQCLHILQGHTHWVYDVTFAPDGKVLASGSLDKTIKLWDIETGQLLQTLQGHTGSVRSVAYSPNGQLLVSGGEDQTFRFWNTADGKLLKTLQGRANWKMPLALSPDGKLLASGDVNHIIHLWDVATGKILQSIKGHMQWLMAIAFSPDGTLLATGAEDFLVCLWDVTTGQKVRTLNQHTEAVPTISFSLDGRFLASGTLDKLVFIWDVATGTVVRRFEEHRGWVESIAYAPSRDLVCRASSCQPTPSQIIASSSTDGTIYLWDADTGMVLMTLTCPSCITCIAFSPDARQLASSSSDRIIRIWDVETGSQLYTLEGHEEQIRSICYAPDVGLSSNSIVLASGANDCTVRLWDAATGQIIQVLEGHTNWVQAIVFHPDGKTLISGSKDEEIRFWDITTGNCYRTFRSERPYEGMNITGVTGLTDAQIEALRVLGAVEDD